MRFMKNIYIILMDTGTIPSIVIKNVIKYKYSHVALSLDDSYKKLYSFGRRNVHNFLNGGFVTYGIDSEFFKKFHNTECAIYEIKVTEKKYKNLENILNKYEKDMNTYQYDIKGLLTRKFFDNKMVRENYFVCSHFVAEVLKEAGIYKFSKETFEVIPSDFTNLDKAIKIYEGKLLEIK